ncbi:MAG: PHP domain-containing protein [Bacillota bacterium]
MEIYDQHVHTEFSVDSEAPYVSYLQALKKMGKTTFVTTEHIDFDKLVSHTDEIPDFERQREFIEMAKKPPYEMKALQGIELSYRPSTAERLSEFLKKEPLDLVILAVHESDEEEVSSPQFAKGKTKNEAYHAYLLLCEYAVEHFDDYDTFAHIDFHLRYLKNLEDIDIQSHKETLTRIFSHIIKKGKSLECNTRFIYRHHDMECLEYTLALYKECGGERITLGSDCHTVADFRSGFPEAIAMLKKIGFESITQYENRIGHAVKI